MLEKNNFRQELSETTLENIKKSFLKINFLIQKDFALDANEAKNHINFTVFHGKASATDMAIYYVEIYGNYKNYMELKYSYELYEYTDHKAIKEEVKKYGVANISNFIDYVALGKDMFEKDIFIDAYYRFKGNVYEITEGKCWWGSYEYVDPDIAEQCYESVKRLIDHGCHLDMAANITYVNFLKEVA